MMCGIGSCIQIYIPWPTVVRITEFISSSYSLVSCNWDAELCEDAIPAFWLDLFVYF